MGHSCWGRTGLRSRRRALRSCQTGAATFSANSSPAPGRQLDDTDRCAADHATFVVGAMSWAFSFSVRMET